MDYKDYYKDTLESRKKGKEVLSWIERLGIDFAERKYNPPKGDNQKGYEFLVLRITEEGNRISAYQCYLNASGNHNRFCVNFYKELVDSSKLRQLLENMHSDEKSTLDWWKEVFVLDNNGIFIVDDAILMNKELTSDNRSDVTLNQLLSQISSIIDEWGIRVSRATTAIYIDGCYSDCLPLSYAISRKYNSCKVKKININAEEFYNAKLKMADVSPYFNIPKELRSSKLNLSEDVTLETIANEGKITITIPLEKGIFQSNVIKSVDSLKWGDLIDDNDYSYSIGDINIKRLVISCFLDGFQGLYFVVDKIIYRISYSNKKKLNEAILFSNSKPTIPINNTSSYNKADNIVDEQDREIKELLRLGKLNSYIQEALTYTIELLRQEADKLIKISNPDKTVLDLFPEWLDIKLSNDEYKYNDVRTNWYKIKDVKKRVLDWGNYRVFLEVNQQSIKKQWGARGYNIIYARTQSIKDNVRNESSHQNINDLKQIDLATMIGDANEIAKVFNNVRLQDEFAKLLENINDEFLKDNN